MAIIRNISGAAADIPLAGRIVEDGEDFTVDDDAFDGLVFSPALFEVVLAPAARGTEGPRGEQLDAQLKAAGLPLTGSADEKRERLAEWQAAQHDDNEGEG